MALYDIFNKTRFREQVKWRTSGTGTTNSLLQYMKKGIDYEDFDVGIPIPNINAQWR